MLFPATLSRYIARSYLEHFGLVLLIVSSGLLLSNTFDTLNRFRSIVFTIPIFLNLILLKLPYLLIEVIPLVGFISALFFLHYLAKSNQLVSIFNTGTSIWNVLMPILVIGITVGILSTTILQPVASIFIGKYDALESKLLKRRSSGGAAISDSGVMIAEDYSNQRRIIIARSVDVTTKELGGLTILLTDSDNNFLSRIDAKSARLDHGKFELHNLHTFNADGSEQLETMGFPTSLSIGRFTEGFASPEHISFWQLPKLIEKLQETGVPTSRYQLYYYKQLFRPIMMIAVCFMATCFTSMRQNRISGLRNFGIGILVGFIVYLVSEILIAILMHNGLTAYAAGIFPIVAIILLSLFVILHLHEAG